MELAESRYYQHLTLSIYANRLESYELATKWQRFADNYVLISTSIYCYHNEAVLIQNIIDFPSVFYFFKFHMGLILVFPEPLPTMSW